MLFVLDDQMLSKPDVCIVAFNSDRLLCFFFNFIINTFERNEGIQTLIMTLYAFSVKILLSGNFFFSLRLIYFYLTKY